MEFGRHFISKISPLATRNPSSGIVVRGGGFKTSAASGILALSGCTRPQLSQSHHSFGVLGYRRPWYGNNLRKFGLNSTLYSPLSTSLITDSAKKVRLWLR